jgi:hypothetical protein
MLPAAKHEDLVYVTNDINNTVTVYSWLGHRLVGMLTGINQPYGACSDQSGNVWIVGWGKNQLFEYAHGGTTPLAILTVHDPQANLNDCSVDPTTGNLAVTNWGNNWDKGYVLIYAHATGTPKVYTGPGLWFYYGCAYDDKGNLFSDGWQAYVQDIFSLSELRKGGDTFTRLELFPTISPPLIGGIRWDGKYVAVGNLGDLYQYQVTGNHAAIVGFTPLTTHWPVGFFWIETFANGKQVIIAPDAAGNPDAVQFWKYPEGGTPSATIDEDLYEPLGVTFSVALR